MEPVDQGREQRQTAGSVATAAMRIKDAVEDILNLCANNHQEFRELLNQLDESTGRIPWLRSASASLEAAVELTLRMRDLQNLPGKRTVSCSGISARSGRCTKRGTAWENGRWYCGHHLPSRRAERNKLRATQN